MKKTIVVILTVVATTAHSYEVKGGYSGDAFGFSDCLQDYWTMAAAPELIMRHNHRPWPYDGPGWIDPWLNAMEVVGIQALDPDHLQFKDFIIVSNCDDLVPEIYKISNEELSEGRKIRIQRAKDAANEGSALVDNF